MYSGLIMGEIIGFKYLKKMGPKVYFMSQEHDVFCLWFSRCHFCYSTMVDFP